MNRPFLHVGIAVFATIVAVIMIAAGLSWFWLLIPLALDLIAAALIEGTIPKEVDEDDRARSDRGL